MALHPSCMASIWAVFFLQQDLLEILNWQKILRDLIDGPCAFSAWRITSQSIGECPDPKCQEMRFDSQLIWGRTFGSDEMKFAIVGRTDGFQDYDCWLSGSMEALLLEASCDVWWALQAIQCEVNHQLEEISGAQWLANLTCVTAHVIDHFLVPSA